MNKITKNRKGMTLLEMMVAVSIFIVITLLTSQIFVMITSGQRRSIAQQNTQENMRYIFEVLGKEIRQAQRSDTQCFSSATNRNYNTTPAKNILYFKNKSGECVSYAIVDDVLVVRRGDRTALATPSFLKITGLMFEVTDNLIVKGTEADVQPRVTFKMKAEMKNLAENINLNMETTVSSRYYE